MSLALVTAALLAVPAIVFTVECLLGLWPLRARSVLAGEAPTFAVLVPAHEEAAGIAATVNAIRPQLRRGDRLLVVADNCTDDTMIQARFAGAEVVERNDPDRRGKGFALAFGRDTLRADPPAIVIVIDADCRIEPGGLEVLAGEASTRNAAVQGAYLMTAPRKRNVLVAISSFAFLVRNLVRQRGLVRLGGAPLLQGSGMAFPWAMFAGAPLASDNIVEDLNLGISLLRQGHRLAWTESARITSLPASGRGTIQQRTRWEHGFVSAALIGVPRLLGGAIRQRRMDMALLAFDLTVPPLALLLFLTGSAWTAMGLLSLMGRDDGPFVVLCVALVALGLAVLFAWAAEGRRLLPLSALCCAPFYILWKLPIYARLLTRREKSWRRTARK